MRTGGGAFTTVTVPPARLADLLAASLPDEELSADELAATLYQDPDGAVLGATDGAVGVAVRGDIGFVTVVVVEPGAQRRGVGRSLLELAHAWLRERGVAVVHAGAAAPRYLWPGIDVNAHAAAVALFESAGYEPVMTTHNHRCPTSFRAPVPAGLDVRRVRHGTADAEAVLAFASVEYPAWVDELERSLPGGCCHAAFEGTGEAVGFGCHSVNRAGWIGPMATAAASRGRGIGAAVLGAVCRDLAMAELDHAEIAWVGPDGFYEKAGAVPSRRFVVLGRRLWPGSGRRRGGS